MSKPNFKNSRRSGFTLIELLLVMVILGVLAAIVVPKFTARSEDARKHSAATTIANLGTALDAYEIDMGHYPSNDEGLSVLVTQPGGTTAGTWKGPYIKQLNNDPWGHAFVYRYPGQHNVNGYDLFSTGPDGQEGGGDDIDNWTQH